MHPDTFEISKHMKEFSFNILGRAIYDACFSELTKPFSHTLAIVHAAHGAEILIKARIAKEHPLLIFSKLPKSNTSLDKLSISELFEYGKTYNYSDLPELLWATTGFRIKEEKRFLEFGNLRNIIIHFAAPEIDSSFETLKYIFEIIDPLCWDLWGETFVPFAQDWDDVIISENYLQEQLSTNKINIDSRTKDIIDEEANG